MNTCQKGQIAELMAELKASEKGFIVSRPAIGFSRYDLIVDDGKKLYRVQVKYACASKCGSFVSVGLRRLNSLRKNVRTYNSNEVDAIMVFVPEMRQLYWIPPSLFNGKKAIQLRFTRAKNIGPIPCNYANEYVW